VEGRGLEVGVVVGEVGIRVVKEVVSGGEIESKKRLNEKLILKIMKLRD